jgi:hypothetical protein
MNKIRLAHQVYMPGSKGPFRCDNCEYYISKNTCNQSKIINYAKKGMFGLTMIGENARVDPNGCSDEFKRK